jgi:hypothetical protein
MVSAMFAPKAPTVGDALVASAYKQKLVNVVPFVNERVLEPVLV